MRIPILVIVLVAVISTTSAQRKRAISRRSIDMFAQKISDSLEWVRSILKKKKISLPSQRNINMNEDGVELHGYVANMTLTGTSNFFVKVESIHEDQSVDVVLKLPRLIHRGRFFVKGSFQDQPLMGEGRFEIAITNLRFHGLAKLVLDDETGLKLSNLKLSYTVQTIKVRADGLKVNGSCKKRNNFRLSKYLQNIAKRDQERIARAVSNAVKVVSNALIGGKTLGEAITMARSGAKSDGVEI